MPHSRYRRRLNKLTFDRTLAKQGLSAFVVFGLFFSINMIVFYLTPNALLNPLLRLTIIPFMCLFFIRRSNLSLVTRLIIQLLFIPAVGVIPLIVTQNPVTWFIFTLMMASGFYSLLATLKGEWTLNILLIVLVFGIYFAVFTVLPTPFVITMFMLSLLAILTYRHINNMEFRVSLIKQSDAHNHPTEKLFSLNNKLFSIMALLVIVVALIVLLIPGAGVIDSAVDGVFFLFVPIQWIMIQLMMLLARILNLIRLPQGEGETDAPDGALWEEAPIGEMMDFGGFQILAIIVGIGALIAVFIFLAHFFGNNEKKKNMKQVIDDSELTNLDKSIMDDLRDLLPKFKPRLHPIRRKYRSTVSSHMQKGIPIELIDTTDKIAKKINPIEDINELTATYENIRYGKEQNE